jgi:predicted phosphodiesterase
MADSEPITIFHISDLHFGRQDPSRIRALMNDINIFSPDLFCITGDIVNFPRKRNFEKAKEFIDSLNRRASAFIVPGNHDAFFGLWRFNQYFEKTEFAEFISRRGRDLCVFGVNSTWFSIPHFGNSGRVTEDRLKRLKAQVERLKKDYGPERYGAACKLVLLHHHPLPTVSNEAEGMLYLKRAGVFLSEVANQGINIVFHGHQHDPCDFSVNHGAGGDDELITILSAGTTLKQEAIQDGLSTKAHYYILRLFPEEVHVESMNYHYGLKKFVQTKSSVKRLRTPPLSEFTLSYKYTVEEDGTLLGEGRAFCRPKSYQLMKDFPVSFGVDEESPPVQSISDCGLETFRGTNLTEWTKVRDAPRDKRANIVLDPALKVGGEHFSWKYRWPGGWSRLLNHGFDEGDYLVSQKVDQLRIEIVNNHPNLKLKFGEIVAPGSKFRPLEAPALGFLVADPALRSRIFYQLVRAES